MLSGNNGIIKKANNSKKETEIAEEKEIIELATVRAMGKNKYGNLTQSEIQANIDSNIAKVYDDGEGFVFLFNSNRIYTIDNEGNIEEKIETYEPLTKSLTNELTNSEYGTEEKPYEIKCIEDLVDLSYKVNGITVDENGSLTYTNTRNSFSNKYIILTKNLNFKLPLSYENATRKDYGDINENGKVEELITELTTGTGWIPIGGNGLNNAGIFSGSFNGNNYTISNLYINNLNETKYSSLFGSIGKTTIKRLNVKGNICCNSSNASGIAVAGNHQTKNVEECSFYGTIKNIHERDQTAGILSYTGLGCTINNCFTGGKIIGNRNVGGIISKAEGDTIITNSYNQAHVSKGDTVGGIVASGGRNISNCYNTGTIQGKGAAYHGAGGIVGFRWP